jgi:hypothetical protein
VSENAWQLELFLDDVGLPCDLPIPVVLWHQKRNCDTEWFELFARLTVSIVIFIAGLAACVEGRPFQLKLGLHAGNWGRVG